MLITSTITKSDPMAKSTLRSYHIEVERGMNVDNNSVKAKDIYNLRKNLISKYTPKRGWDETTVVVFHEDVGQFNQPIIKDYIGTFYIYGSPKHMTYSWSVNKKNNWGNYRHSMPKTKSYAVNPIDGKLIK